jgi:alkylation response protein AidB-like acyl-CoA dehydrogenase
MTDDELIARVREWLAANWDAQAKRGRNVASALEWRRAVHAAGFSVPSWPESFGGLGLTPEQSKLVEREFKRVGAPGAGIDRANIPANTVLQYGTDRAKAELLDKFVTEEIGMCLLYSEPGAGSDLAGVRTRADLQGDHYLINGQKVWTSGAMSADYGLLLCRTDCDVPKHAGLSFMLCPMKQEGIEVRPIHQINGESHFNEVFIDNAKVPVHNLLAGEGQGWKVMQTALAYERLIMGEGAIERDAGGSANEIGGKAPDAGRDLVEFARRHGRLGDPVMRQQIAQAVAWRRLNTLNGARAKAAAASGEASPLMSMGKLAVSRVLHEDARVRREILGARGLIDGPECQDAKDMNFRSLHAYMNSIGGGTDQIQRNIIGERVLGLPREVEVDRNIPFRESLGARAG